jgi:hypothetical protein
MRYSKPPRSPHLMPAYLLVPGRLFGSLDHQVSQVTRCAPILESSGEFRTHFAIGKTVFLEHPCGPNRPNVPTTAVLLPSFAALLLYHQGPRCHNNLNLTLLATSHAKSNTSSTSCIRALEFVVPPTRPSTPSSNRAALCLMMPTSM